MTGFDQFVGTRSVSEKHRFDEVALTQWLEQNLDKIYWNYFMV